MNNQVFNKKYCQNILQQKKLILICDIDETLITSIHLKDPISHQYLKNVHYDKQASGHHYKGLCTKFRPYLTEFLTKISEKYELHVMSMGNDSYVRSIVNMIDPNKTFFGDRITSRTDIVNGEDKLQTMKNQFDEMDNIVCVIDDRLDVWNYSERVVQVDRYMIFSKIASIYHDDNKKLKYCRTFLIEEMLMNMKDTDDHLNHVLSKLELIHKRYFESIDEKLLKNNYKGITRNNVPKIDSVISDMRQEGISL